jgi:hypothetical protein
MATQTLPDSARGTMAAQSASAVAITGGTITGLTGLSTTAACTALLGGAAASAQSSLAVLASKTVAAPVAGTVWRGLDFQASTLTLTAGGTAPSALYAARFAAPVITQTAGAAYTVPVTATVVIEGPPTASAVGGATPTLTAGHALVVGGRIFVTGNYFGTGGIEFDPTTYSYGTTNPNIGNLGPQLLFVGGCFLGGANRYIAANNDTYPATIGTATTRVNLTAYQIMVTASKTVASAADAVWDGIKFAANVASITGATAITTAEGFNFTRFGAPTINCDTAGLTIDHSATVFIAGAPVAGTNTPTLSDNLALWIAGGNVKFGSLAGTGSRAVVADANGVLSAP